MSIRYRIDMDVFKELTAIAERAGAVVGVTDLAPFPAEAAELKARVAEGLHGGLSFTFARPDLASTPAESFPWASSIVVVAAPYLRDGDGLGDAYGLADKNVATPQRTVARFADGDRYRALDAILAEIAEHISRRGERVEIVYDDSRLLDRAVALRAGVAWQGKSTMALTPRFGPWILIGSVLTELKLPQTTPMRRSCGTCNDCIPACPTDAIIAPGVLDARRCISAVLQRRGVIDATLRSQIGGRIYGCDECLAACPPGRKAVAAFEPASDVLLPKEVLDLSDEELEELVDHWYVPSRKMRFVRRNALVALGNTGDESHLPLLAEYLAHSDPLLRLHAGWAIGRIAGTRAEMLCVTALENEPDHDVRAELAAAVTASRQGGVYAEGVKVNQSSAAKEDAR